MTKDLFEGSGGPRYRVVKDFVREEIKSGRLRPGDKVPSENQLGKKFGLSRMTVNRAVVELTQEGYLRRVAGSGTFVSDSPVYANPLEIQNIRQEIKDRGGKYSAEILHLAEETRDDFVGLERGARVFHVVMVHREDGLALQLEDRLVNPEIAPHFMRVNFEKTSPGEYLRKSAPLQQTEHVVEAVMPDAAIAADLKIGHRDPCLLITRRTWAGGKPASVARLYHPGHRYRLGGVFKPNKHNS